MSQRPARTVNYCPIAQRFSALSILRNKLDALSIQGPFCAVIHYFDDQIT